MAGNFRSGGVTKSVDFKYGAKLKIFPTRKARSLRYGNPTGSLSKYVEGELIGNIYGYTTIGIAKTDEEMQQHLASLPNGGQSALGSQWAAGDIMYADLNGDGKINNGSYTINDMGDMKKIGNSTPRFMTGINPGCCLQRMELTNVLARRTEARLVAGR